MTFTNPLKLLLLVYSCNVASLFLCPLSLFLPLSPSNVLLLLIHLVLSPSHLIMLCKYLRYDLLFLVSYFFVYFLLILQLLLLMFLACIGHSWCVLCLVPLSCHIIYNGAQGYNDTTENESAYTWYIAPVFPLPSHLPVTVLLPAPSFCWPSKQTALRHVSHGS